MNPQRPHDISHPSVSALIGVAQCDITPPVGIYARQWGAAEHDASEGIHRPLTAGVMAIRESADGPPLVLCTLDAGWWQNLDNEIRVRNALIDAHGLDPDRVLIALSHTHAACSLCTDDAGKPGGDLVDAYLSRIADALIDATGEALAATVPATLDWTTGRCGLAANRDLPDPDADRYVCGFNPDVPADDTVLVGRVTDQQERIIATVVNYACHATTLAWDNKLISPDYVGAMREVIQNHTDGVPCLFLQGASGDLGPREGFTGDLDIAESNGRYLGYSVVAALESMLPPRTAVTYAGVVESGAPIATWRRQSIEPLTDLVAERIDVPLPLKPLPSVAEVRKQLDECTDRVMAERLRRKLRLLDKVGSGPTVPVPIWFWRLGNVVLIAHPNESYSVFQTSLRRQFPDITLPIVTVVNGGMGYVSPPELHDTDIYQVWCSPFGRDAMPTLLDACQAQIGRMIRHD